MERVELHAAVARALLPGLNGGRGPSGTPEEGADALARAAIGVVLAEANRSIEALPRFEGGGLLRSNGAWVSRREALAVLAALGDEALEPPPPV